MGLGRLFASAGIGAGSNPPPETSVIIPTYNEAGTITATISAIRACATRPAEIIVADGHSSDATARQARESGARVVMVRGGRAAQLNVAAQGAHAPRLLFLHADTTVPAGFDIDLESVLAGRGIVAGAFRLRVASDMFGIRFVERMANLRASLLQRPYGDQGLFMTQSAFQRVGGYPDMPFLDDYEMVRRLSRQGRIAISSRSAVTSGRRWEALGVVRTTIMNQVVIGAYHLGVPVVRLRAWYRGVLQRAAERQRLRGRTRAGSR